VWTYVLMAVPLCMTAALVHADIHGLSEVVILVSSVDRCLPSVNICLTGICLWRGTEDWGFGILKVLTVRRHWPVDDNHLPQFSCSCF
jgi:hypothetical protein